MDSEKQLYQAIVWKLGREQPGERTTILADSLEKAEQQLRRNYGDDIAFTLYNEDDASKIR